MSGAKDDAELEELRRLAKQKHAENEDLFAEKPEWMRSAGEKPRRFYREPGKRYMRCPFCGGFAELPGLSALSWVGVVLLFPLGLLAFVLPRECLCPSCGQTFRGKPWDAV